MDTMSCLEPVLAPVADVAVLDEELTVTADRLVTAEPAILTATTKLVPEAKAASSSVIV